MATTTTTSTDAPRVVRIGMMSTANIGGKYRRAIALCSTPSATNVSVELYAVASRDIAKAQAWATKENVPVAYGSYEELLADPKVDAVYMPLPCAMHKEWAVKAVQAGKAVLIEKPTATSTDELRTIISACAAKNVQIMDGTMFMHHDRMPKMRAAIDALCGREATTSSYSSSSSSTAAASGGRVLRLSSGFSFLGDADFHANNIRVRKELEPFGVLGDLGWYQIRFALWVMNWELPSHVSCRALKWGPGGAADGVPIDMNGLLIFGNTKNELGDTTTLAFDCGFTTPFRQWMEVSGEKGVLKLDDFVITRSHASCEYQVITNPGLDASHSNVIGDKETIEVKGCNQEERMVRAFAECVANKTFESHWPRISLLTQSVLDACYESIEKDGADVAVQAVTFP